MAYIKKIWKDYPDTTAPILAEDLNNIENGIETVDTALETVDTALENIENNVDDIEDGLETVTNNVNNGWISLNGTFTYSSADSPTFVMTTSVDLTGIVGLGMRIKLTQTTTQYFIVTAITNDSITMYGGTDYTLTNSIFVSISNVYYSMLKAPFGFPLDPAKWSLVFTDTAAQQQNTPAKAVVYNLGNSSLNLPIGNWNVNYEVLIYIVRSSSSVAEATVSLSTSNSTFTDTDFSYTVYNNPSSAYMVVATKNKTLNITTPTTYYLLISTSNPSGVSYFQFRGSISTTKITATCAYL